MMRSRLRKPTSKSITAVLWPRSARPAAKLALVVVLPTPPLPEVTTMILAIRCASFPELPAPTVLELHFLEHQFFALQPHLRRFAAQFGRYRRIAGAIDAGDRHQLRFHAHGEDARIDVAQGTRDRTSSQRRIHVH